MIIFTHNNLKTFFYVKFKERKKHLIKLKNSRYNTFFIVFYGKYYILKSLIKLGIFLNILSLAAMQPVSLEKIKNKIICNITLLNYYRILFKSLTN